MGSLNVGFESNSVSSCICFRRQGLPDAAQAGARAAGLEWKREQEDVEITAPKRLVHQMDSDEELAHERLDTRVNDHATPQVSGPRPKF